MRLEACLPPQLCGAGTTITKIAAGLSGAGVYRVDANGSAYVLKVADQEHPLVQWQRTLFILRAASDAGLAPRLIHADVSRRAIVSEFVSDQSFPRFYRDPRTHDAALTLLGETLRRAHVLPIPPDAVPFEPLQLLGTIWSGVPSNITFPRFVTDAVERALTEQPPIAERPLVLSHNDPNPTNLVLDGDRIVLVDWDTAAPNHPLYDLAVVSLFSRMNEETCRRLIAAHDGAPCSQLPPTFLYYRRLTGVMLGVGFLSFARQGGYDGEPAPDTLEAVPPLGEFYQKLQSGAVNLNSGEGRWAFGLGLLKEAHALDV